MPVVIVNPVSAGGRTAKLWPRLARELGNLGIDFVSHLTTGPGSATLLARQAIQDGAETVVVVGGDGTINEVINGFFVADEPLNPAARLAIVPSGTGRDLSKTLRIPPGVQALSCLTSNRERRLDLGLATFRDLDGQPARRYFVNIVDLGLGGDTVKRMNGTSKMLGGFLSFLLATIASIARARNYPVELTADGEPCVSLLAGTVLLGNGQYFAGGMHVAPMAQPDDGYLDLITLGDTSRTQLMFNLLPRVYRGRHMSHPKVTWRRARSVSVRSSETVLMEMDGELVGSTDASFTIVPEALTVLTPLEADTPASMRTASAGEPRDDPRP